jgi:hypothetical protein
MWRTLVLAIFAWSVVPYKSWSRSIIRSEGFNIGDFILIIIAVPMIFVVISQYKRVKIYKDILLIWLILFLAIAKGLFFGEESREMLRVARASVFLITIPIMVKSLTDKNKLLKWFKLMSVMLIILSGTIILFSYNIRLIPQNDEMASYRNISFGGYERVFTLGMMAVIVGLIFTSITFFLNKRKKLYSLVLSIFLLSGLFFTFVRTYFFTLIFIWMIFFMKNWKLTLKTLSKAILLILLIILLVGLPNVFINIINILSYQISMVITSDISNVDPTDAMRLGTIIWRFSEINYSMTEFNNVLDYMIGNLGRKYILPNGYVNSIPHIGYWAVIYSFGILGAIVYFRFIFRNTIELWKRIKQAPKDNNWLEQALFFSWLGILIIGFSSSIFHLPYNIATIAFVLGVSEVNNNLKEKNKNGSELSQNINCNTVF